jgi:hypothetical protein
VPSTGRWEGAISRKGKWRHDEREQRFGRLGFADRVLACG